MAHPLITALDGKEGLDIYDGTPDGFDVIVTDYKMPKLDGIGVAEQLKASGSDTPIILLTGHMGFTDDLGMNYLEILSKPFEIGELLELLDKAEALMKKI